MYLVAARIKSRLLTPFHIEGLRLVGGFRGGGQTKI